MPRILLVDDEPNVLEGIARRLRHDCEIFVAMDGAHALEVLEQHGEMDIVLTDMRVPVVDGAALLAQLVPLHPDVVRILLTGQADIASAISAVDDGHIFRFLVKPCPSDVLRPQLKAALRRARAARADVGRCAARCRRYATRAVTPFAPTWSNACARCNPAWAGAKPCAFAFRCKSGILRIDSCLHFRRFCPKELARAGVARVWVHAADPFAPC